MKAAADAPASRAIRKIRIRALAFFALAALAGIGAVLLVFNYLSRVQRAAGNAQLTTRNIVVSAVDVAIGTPLEAAFMETVPWPVQHLPEGVFDSAKVLIGRTVRQSLIKGEPILKSKLADEKAGQGLTALLGEGMRAMAVKVDQVVGVAGFVKPGDYVDVITTMAPDEDTRRRLSQEAAMISKIILQNVKVLAVGEQMQSAGSRPVKVQVVTLEVDSDQSERLALASGHGKIQLTMRSRIDQTAVPTAGITPTALLSPDIGAKKEEPVAKAEPPRVRSKASAKPVAEAKPEAPVIEVLRGGKVEERKLRPSADSQ